MNSRAPVRMLWALAVATPLTSPAADTADGAAVWASVCRHCHATGVGPALLGRGLDPAYVESVVRNGLRAMPAFRPSEVPADELAALARRLAATPPPPAATAGALP